MSASPTTPTFTIRPMSLRDFAEAAGVSIRHLYRLIETGDLAVNRLGRRVIIPATEVERHLVSAAQVGNVSQARPPAPPG